MDHPINPPPPCGLTWTIWKPPSPLPGPHGLCMTPNAQFIINETYVFGDNLVKNDHFCQFLLNKNEHIFWNQNNQGDLHVITHIVIVGISM